MIALKNILVPTDFGPTSQRALDTGAISRGSSAPGCTFCTPSRA